MNADLPRLVSSRLDRGYPVTSCELILKMQQAILVKFRVGGSCVPYIFKVKPIHVRFGFRPLHL